MVKIAMPNWFTIKMVPEDIKNRLRNECEKLNGEFDERLLTCTIKTDIEVWGAEHTESGLEFKKSNMKIRFDFAGRNEPDITVFDDTNSLFKRFDKDEAEKFVNLMSKLSELWKEYKYASKFVNIATSGKFGPPIVRRGDIFTILKRPTTKKGVK